MNGCIFCRIVAGDAPAAIVHETPETLAFLDVAPATEGHTLVVPKTHCADLFDIGPERAAIVMQAAVEVAAILDRALKPAGMNLMHASRAAAWQSVFHFHLHLIPRYRIDELRAPFPIGRNRAPAEELTRVASTIREA